MDENVRLSDFWEYGWKGHNNQPPELPWMELSGLEICMEFSCLPTPGNMYGNMRSSHSMEHEWKCEVIPPLEICMKM